MFDYVCWQGFCWTRLFLISVARARVIIKTCMCAYEFCTPSVFAPASLKMRWITLGLTICLHAHSQLSQSACVIMCLAIGWVCMHGCGLHFAVGQSRVLLNARALRIFLHAHTQLSKHTCLNMCVDLAQYACILCVLVFILSGARAGFCWTRLFWVSLHTGTHNYTNAHVWLGVWRLAAHACILVFSLMFILPKARAGFCWTRLCWLALYTRTHVSNHACLIMCVGKGFAERACF